MSQIRHWKSLQHKYWKLCESHAQPHTTVTPALTNMRRTDLSVGSPSTPCDTSKFLSHVNFSVKLQISPKWTANLRNEPRELHNELRNEPGHVFLCMSVCLSMLACLYGLPCVCVFSCPPTYLCVYLSVRVFRWLPVRVGLQYGVYLCVFRCTCPSICRSGACLGFDFWSVLYVGVFACHCV